MLMGIALALLVTAGSANAQLSPDDVANSSEPNAAYADAIWGRGVQSELTYLKPSAPFDPDASVRIKVPEKPKEQRTDVDSIRVFWGVIFALILAVIIYVFIANGNGVGVSFRTTGDAARPNRPAEGPNTDASMIDTPGLEALLARLAAMADKREALILLVSEALERAALATNVRLARAQTARDVLRALPRDWPHLETLRRLVREVEIAHFGGRDVSPEKWEACMAAAVPLFKAGKRA